MPDEVFYLWHPPKETKCKTRDNDYYLGSSWGDEPHPAPTLFGPDLRLPYKARAGMAYQWSVNGDEEYYIQGAYLHIAVDPYGCTPLAVLPPTLIPICSEQTATSLCQPAWLQSIYEDVVKVKPLLGLFGSHYRKSDYEFNHFELVLQVGKPEECRWSDEGVTCEEFGGPPAE